MWLAGGWLAYKLTSAGKGYVSGAGYVPGSCTPGAAQPHAARFVSQ